MDYKKRFPLIDQLRGIAVVLMIIFHLCYDLTHFGFLQINFYKDIFWLILPRIIVFLFLFCVGISLPLTHIPQIKWRKFWHRFGKIALAALLISLFTYFVFPTQWVYFGTLHCIATCSLLALPFLRYPRIALILAITLAILVILKIPTPWINLKHKSMDYIPALPWVGVVYLGLFAHSIKLHYWQIPSFSGATPLQFLGRYSLIIYLLHQPLLFGLVYLIRLVT